MEKQVGKLLMKQKELRYPNQKRHLKKIDPTFQTLERLVRENQKLK